MVDHRIRLNDTELRLITAALRSRFAGVSPARAAELEHLVERLEECARGNPRVTRAAGPRPYRADDALIRSAERSPKAPTPKPRTSPTPDR